MCYFVFYFYVFQIKMFNFLPSKFLLKVVQKLPLHARVCSNENVTDYDIHKIMLYIVT